VRVETTDTGRTWVLTLGRFDGSEPHSDKTYADERDMRIAATDDGAPTAATVRGAAADLDCWLWIREPLGPVEQTGDQEVLAELHRTIGGGID
jgi:hypothetical protein